MKIKNILKITELVCITVIISMVNLPFSVGGDRAAEKIGNYSKLGYKPVPDTYSYAKDSDRLNDNPLYKKWCEETFDNGDYIYEAYKNIAFNIKYTPETNGMDYWQTPMETTGLKSGDCEDIAFSFFSKIPSNMRNAGIVWGWVIDKRTKAGWAHVWYQLTDRKGQKYVVEGFSNDWNGIIPMEIIQDTETRKPIFIISHGMLNKLSCLLPKVEKWQMSRPLLDLFTEASFTTHVSGSQRYGLNMNVQRHLSSHEYVEYPENTRGGPGQYTRYTRHSLVSKDLPGVNKEISNIFEKLHELFSRYADQKNGCEIKRIW